MAMTSKSNADDEKAGVRAAIFNHLAGIVLAPVVKGLADRGAFELFEDPAEWVPLDRIIDRTRGNRAYLKIALRLLTSCGWLKQQSFENGRLSAYLPTQEGTVALRVAP